MTIANIRARQQDGTFDCGRAQIRAHCRHLATVVTVRGEIGADNAERVSQYIRRFILEDNTVVLDLSEVRRCDAAGAWLLARFDESCLAAGVDWMLVASPAVTEALDAGDRAAFPITHSVRDALHDLADAIVSRRQLVLPLIKKSA
ncbi:STAS domain-containing protein [Mycobacterium parmense]|uniref:Sulfate transporter n=1 Tax=Mycobacterium parmense TaxID=185642 RepID=A0A7I7YWA8_9MYCO|nr:STAS domain-containing protein [Mycobacterium parmense]MCV7350605.1 STAS domain-containing protein [Mycobacterium parmense]ORW48315.1 sulfate transporter [Mycobacterium parmense]BBZ45969.1 sulfate transporter [Mycobacterium parmense]